MPDLDNNLYAFIRCYSWPLIALRAALPRLDVMIAIQFIRSHSFAVGSRSAIHILSVAGNGERDTYIYIDPNYNNIVSAQDYR